MRLLSNGLVIAGSLLGGALSCGCGVDSPVIRICEPSRSRALDLSAQSALGFSGAQLREQAVGDYDVTATRQGQPAFALKLTVTSNADRADETDAGANASPACPSTLKIQAHFELVSEAGELEGAWDGVIIGARSAAGIAARGEATVPRERFSRLPEDADAESFSFGTTLASASISGSLAEVVEPGGTGQTHQTESPLTVASWGDAAHH